MPDHCLIAYDLLANSELWRNNSFDGKPLRMLSLFNTSVNLYVSEEHIELFVRDSEMEFLNRFDRKSGALIMAPGLIEPIQAFDAINTQTNDKITIEEIEVE